VTPGAQVAPAGPHVVPSPTATARRPAPGGRTRGNGPMPLDAAFAPYHISPGATGPAAAPAPPADGETRPEPVVGAPGMVPAALVERALAEVPAGLAAPGVAPCPPPTAILRHGGPARACPAPRPARGGRPGHPRGATAGFGGVLWIVLTRRCRTASSVRASARGQRACPSPRPRIRRPLPGDRLPCLTCTALAEASGAVSFEKLPFGRDFGAGGTRRSMSDRLRRAGRARRGPRQRRPATSLLGC
jgi:hypothetical protein